MLVLRNALVTLPIAETGCKNLVPLRGEMAKSLRENRPSAMKAIAALLVALAVAPASAQVVRCQDGAFREASACPGAPKPGAVSQPYQTPEPAKVEIPPECRFRYFALSDEKGKALSSNASKECIRNNAFKASGQPAAVTYEAYTLWKDHFQIESARRSRANAANRPKQPMKCKPDFFSRGEFTCE